EPVGRSVEVTERDRRADEVRQAWHGHRVDLLLALGDEESDEGKRDHGDSVSRRACFWAPVLRLVPAGSRSSLGRADSFLAAAEGAAGSTGGRQPSRTKRTSAAEESPGRGSADPWSIRRSAKRSGP